MRVANADLGNPRCKRGLVEDILESKAKAFISFLKELDFVTINTNIEDNNDELTDAQVIFGLSKPANSR